MLHTRAVPVPGDISSGSLYTISRLKGDVDPYDMSRWSIVRRGRTAHVRYRFHTRSLEMQDPLKKLTRAVPDVSIALVTHCLDDGDFGAFTIAKGRCKGGWLGDDWRTPFWERAARALGMTLEEAYEDDDAEMRAESLMRDEAVRIAAGTDRRFDWSGGRVYRDLWDERAILRRDLAAEIKRMDVT